MSDEQPDPNAAPDDDAEVAEVASLVVDDGKGNKMVPLSALVGAKKSARDLNKRNKELEASAAESAQLKDRLDKAQPFIDALVTDPKLRAAAIRVVQGTHASPGSTEQPDDSDATAVAEGFGFYLSDGATLDVARAKRVMTRIDARTRRQTDAALRPLAGIVAGSQAERNVHHAMTLTDDNGRPYATQESIREISSKLDPALLANPDVMDIVLNSAIGLDVRKGRTVAVPDEPLWQATAGGRRPTQPTISQETKASLDKLGLTEKEYAASSKRLESSGGRAIVLGRD